MKESLEWMKARPIVSFLSLTLVLTYALLFPVVYLMGMTDQFLIGILTLYAARLGVYVPVLIGMLVTRWALPDRSPTSASKRWLIFGVVSS